MMPLYLYGVLSTKKWTFFTAVNPSLPTGGFLGEDKSIINKLFPSEFFPKQIVVSQSDTAESIKNAIKNNSIHYPFFVKPLRGERGEGVKLVTDFDDLTAYQKDIGSFLIQENISAGEELGIFWIRNPSEEQGRISSITTKKYPQVLGDGIKNMQQLIQQDKRLKLYQNYLFSKIEELTYVPKNGEVIMIHQIGNHSKGTQFFDGRKLITPELTDLINEIFSKVSGIYYGRLDAKIQFSQGLPIKESVKIIEFNGVMAEPAHIYGNSWIFNAWKDIFSHWVEILKISKINIKKGAKTAPFLTLYLQLKNK